MASVIESLIPLRLHCSLCVSKVFASNSNILGYCFHSIGKQDIFVSIPRGPMRKTNVSA
jgi:hypothetical protein